MNERLIIGVDPGLSGAIAAIDHNGLFRGVWDMPVEVTHTGKNRVCAWLLLQVFKEIMEMAVDQEGADVPVMCYVESVSAMPGQGVTSMFNFGDGFGVVRAVIAVSQVPVTFVSPVKWKRTMGMIGTDKNYSLTLARQYWPDAPLTLKKHTGRADALLIAKAHL